MNTWLGFEEEIELATSQGSQDFPDCQGPSCSVRRVFDCMEAICLSRKSELDRNEAYKKIIDEVMISLGPTNDRPDGVYIQEEKAATYQFCMPGRRVPSWIIIIKRITVAMPSLEVLEDYNFSAWDKWDDLVHPLPNPAPQKITSIFFWNYMKSVPAIMAAVAGSGPRLRVLYLADYTLPESRWKYAQALYVMP